MTTQINVTKKQPYFSTRDLLMMAALAALGGVTSTYVNALSKMLQSVTGAPGGSQWAAGLHVLWIVLAVGLTGKQGAGTATGILKGAVELLSGNSHGLLVMLVDVVAGLLVDLGFLPFRDKRKRVAYMLAGGLASASNVFIFQLFAALPAEMFAYWVMLFVGLVAFVSGVVFSGLLGETLVLALYRAGVVREQPHPSMSKRATWILYSVLVVLTIAFGAYLLVSLQGPSAIEISGAVEEPIAWTLPSDQALITRQAEQNGVPKSFAGVPLREVIATAEPIIGDGMVLVTATDGYAFFISLAEIASNDNLLLVPKGSGNDVSYDVMGAESSKAWVRTVATMVIASVHPMPIEGDLEIPRAFEPSIWQFDMDAFNLDIGNGVQKLQGTPLRLVLESVSPDAGASIITLEGRDSSTTTLAMDDVMNSDDIRIFTVINEQYVTYAVANQNGTVYVADAVRIEVSQ